MTLKTPSLKERENEKARGKKRFLERKVQEQEAEADINNYKDEHPDYPTREEAPRKS